MNLRSIIFAAVLAAAAAAAAASGQTRPSAESRPTGPAVAVYRNAAGAGREAGVARYARVVTGSLDRLGIRYELLEDKAVGAGGLAGMKVAVLPLNPVLPKDAAAAMGTFVAGGGKLLVCYHLPKPLGGLLGLRLGGAIDGADGRLDAISFQGREDRKKVLARQHSWIARTLIAAGKTKVVGRWVDKSGKATTAAAVTRNKNGYFVGHVLTGHDPAGTDRLLIEMLGQLWPDAWKRVYAHRLSRLGKLAGLGGPAEIAAAARANAGESPRAKPVKALLSKAEGLARDAKAIMRYGDAITAAETLDQAQQAYLRAYAASLQGRPGELRAVWCHDPAGVRGWTWDQAMAALAGGGFNTAIVNMLWGGGAAYPSRLLPTIEKARGRDLLAECAAAARKHRIALHVWKVNWNLGWQCPKPFREKMLQAERLQRDARGKVVNWLCPSDPANRKLEADSMLEIVGKYPVAGIHFDYIRYPNASACFCRRCRKRFEAACKLEVKGWPGDVRSGKLKDKYLQFRRDNITALVAEVAGRARKVKPTVLISAAVVWNWPSARDRIGQDWRLWIEKGYLDFVCPMQYTTSAAEFERRTKATSGWVGGRVPLAPGIGATLGLTGDEVLRQVLIARKHKTAGFVLFDYNTTLADDCLPILRLGATADKSVWAAPRRGKAPAAE